MTLPEILVLLCAGLLLVVGAVHSIFGERLLLKPMFHRRGNKVLDNGLARMVLRFAWHLTTVLWLLLAYIICTVVFTPERAVPLTLWSVGLTFLAVGVFDLIVSKGRHIGWPILTAIGATALAAALTL
ncbi:hypothetical protein [Pontivivens insulae]|uniref:Uncharacterized protein n=1 Tax=Pontivivens insulae TaxID=1639689 RepID=A0A2R8A9A7_9RHOB|nr:hypothetical protein [Pontivivens insulae]RED12730.1 hypothetical protein DFR53_1859 [Pontivivens insulae]SPF28821.1 hypothetical protein POI8812_01124 [Pontivivens insulae]